MREESRLGGHATREIAGMSPLTTLISALEETMKQRHDTQLSEIQIQIINHSPSD
jgi:hypothetical protein